MTSKWAGTGVAATLRDRLAVLRAAVSRRTRGVARMVTMLTLSSVALVATGCSAPAADSSAPYFATSRPAVNVVGPVDASSGLLATAAGAARGPVARPDATLTPGVVAVHDVDTVCHQPKRARDPIPYTEQQAIFGAYKIRYPQDAKKYGLDYLIPVSLGGSAVQANIWPAAVKGVGFHEKERLNARLRQLVCQGLVPLAQVQQELATNWYGLWIQYGS